jgi:hypothetical protein
LAALLTRKLTIRYSAESDKVQSAEAALDAGKVLTNWSQSEKDTLLERGLFGFANYGRVRFHHRSALEYAARQMFPTRGDKAVRAQSIRGRVTAAPIRRHIDNAMVKAVARAFRWREMLEKRDVRDHR